MILEKVYQKVRTGTANSQKRHSHKERKHKSCHKLQNRFTTKQPSLSAMSVSEAPRNMPSGQILPPHSTLADE